MSPVKKIVYPFRKSSVDLQTEHTGKLFPFITLTKNVSREVKFRQALTWKAEHRKLTCAANSACGN